MTFKYSVLTAVSSTEQATDEKASLDDQLRNARQYGERNGGTFTREYRADGYSRVGYWDLSQAFADIPAFGDLARDAYRNAFDVVIVDSFDRLGSTAFAFWEWLKPQRKQFRSVQQALQIENPETYNPSHDDSTTNMIVQAMMVQNYRINKITRAFEIGNIRRVQRGSYGNKIPIGYAKVDKSTVVPDGHYSTLIAKLPGWYLGGMTTGEVVNAANASGINPPNAPRWTNRVITYIMQNPFYAGKVFYKDEFGDGNQEPLWTWDTYQAMQAEIDRRKSLRHLKRDYNLTGLLHCSVCDGILHISYSTVKRYKNWVCDDKHVRLRTELADELVANEIIRLFSARDYAVDGVEIAQGRAQRDLAALGRQFSKLEQAYYAGAYTALEFADKKKELEAHRAELQDEEKQREETKRRAEESRQILATMKDILPFLHDWITSANPRLVKYHLSRVVRLTAHPDKRITGEMLV